MTATTTGVFGATDLRDPLTAALNGPLRLLPNRVPRYFRGGRQLDELLGFPAPRDDNWSEEWLGNATRPGFGTAGGSGEARTLLLDGTVLGVDELMRREPERVLGAAHVAAYGTSPGLLLKYLDVGSPIPVHVHPTRAFARRHLGSRFGKNEAWLIVAARPVDGVAPRVWLGWREPVTPAQLAGWVERQDIAAMRAAMHEIAVHVDDVLFVPAGVPHALGAGILAMEPQEPTDFAVVAECAGYDIPEPLATNGLGWETALEMFDHTPLSDRDVRERIRCAPRVARESAGGSEHDLLSPEASGFFRLARWTVSGTFAVPARDTYSVLAVRSGAGTLRGPWGEVFVRRGETYLAPACLGEHDVVCESRDPLVVLVGRPPDPEGA